MTKEIWLYFGEMGGGESYQARAFAQAHYLPFIEGDDLLTPAMKDCVTNFQPLTKDLFEPFLKTLQETVATRAKESMRGVVVAQALYRRAHREQCAAFWQAKGYVVHLKLVRPSMWTNFKQLRTRPNGWKWVRYWLMNKPWFQK